MKFFLLIACIVIGIAFILLAAKPATAQTRIGLELSAGRADMFFPLVEDRSYLDENGFSVIGDENRSGGVAATLRLLLLTNIELQFDFNMFSRESMGLQYRSKQLVNPRRQRTDGTVDDAGVEYIKLDEAEELKLDYKYREDMLILSLMGGYRFYLYTYKNLYLYANVGGGFALAKINGTPYDWRFGVKIYAGVGLLYKFITHLGIFINISFNGIFCQDILHPEDASRIYYQTGGTSEQAILDGTIFSNVQAGLHYTFQ